MDFKFSPEEEEFKEEVCDFFIQEEKVVTGARKEWNYFYSNEICSLPGSIIVVTARHITRAFRQRLRDGLHDGKSARQTISGH